jgi:hypothetical protein
MNSNRRKEIDAVIAEIEAITARMSDVWLRIDQIGAEEKPGAARDAIGRAMAAISTLDFDAITDALDESAASTIRTYPHV